MKKRNMLITAGLLLAGGLFYGGISVYYEFYPAPKEPSATWESYVNSLNAQREAFFVDADGVKLESELFIPNGGASKKPAIVFAPGSGDALYQNYSPDFIETYILDFFISHDFAVLLVNKRGMGLSEGLYTDLSIEGRAEDVLTSVKAIQAHPRIDASKIGLVGHSEGGWTVTYAAAQNPDIAFFINLAGPTITRMEQAVDMYTFEAICSGLEGAELDEYVEKRTKKTKLGMKIGKVINFGLLGFDYRSMSFDPRNALETIKNPGLFIFAENDILVIPAKNIERMNEIFDGDVPGNFTMTIVKDATHSFRLVDVPCDSWNESTQYEMSTEVTTILNDWLNEFGY